MARLAESPMDWQYDNKTGPINPESGYGKLAASHQQQQQEHQRQQQQSSKAEKRPRSIFESNTKNEVPSLRAPASQKFLFSQPPSSPVKRATSPEKSLPALPSHSTPRKLEIDYASSGLETSPENNADSEATPEMGIRTGLRKLSTSVTHMMGNTKSKSNLALTRITGTPGKGEISRPYYSTGAENRVRKMRKRDGERRLAQRKGSLDSESEDDTSPKGHKNAQAPIPPTGPSAIASFFGFINGHPDLPNILSYYAQLLLNFFLIFFLMYLIYSFWSTIRADVDKKSDEAITEILADMAVCARSYEENRCDKETRLPALAVVCENWERCMKRDPRSVGRAKVSAHTFAEIFNSFIEPISYKAMIFSTILIVGCFAVNNLVFGMFRNKAQQHHFQHQQPFMQTPQHPGASFDSYWNQYQSPTRERGPGYNTGSLDMQSPTKRIQYY